MNKPVDPVSELEMHAYVDKQLSAQRAAEIERYLQDNPKEMARVKEYQQINLLLQRRHSRIIKESLPPRFERTIAKSSIKIPISAWAIAASMAWAFVGGVVGWYLHDQDFEDNLSAMALAKNAVHAHVIYTAEVRHPVEVKAENEKHLVGWLSKRLGKKILAPKLEQLGFELIGGRLLPSDGEPAAQLMYENSSGARVTLYIRSRKGNDITAFRYIREGQTSVFYWIDNSLGYALTGDIDKDNLLTIATAVYQILDGNKMTM